jgi:hypothetical protein
MTFLELKVALVSELFPDGLAENLIIPFANSVRSAMIDLQRWCSCLQVNHTSTFAQCSTYYRCGTTVIDAPVGRVELVATISGTSHCRRITYGQRSWKEFQCWSRGLSDLITTAPTNTGLPLLPLGFKYPEAITDSLYGRALVGIWCLHKGKLWVAPWLQSDETLVVEWDGMKMTWADADTIWEDRDIQRAISLYVQQDHPQWFPNGSDFYAKWKADFETQRGDLIWECNERNRVKASNTCGEDIESELLQDQTPDVSAAEAVDPNQTVFAVIGDFGSDDANELAVSELVKSKTLNFIATAGDNYNTGADIAPVYDNSVGQYYAEYVAPWLGNPLYDKGVLENAFFPAIGNHDYGATAAPSLNEFKNFFRLPGNGRYYEFVSGAAHIFVINSNNDETDGNASNSVQGAWLQKRLALSTAPWKVVVFHHAPYCSEALHGSSVTMQWPFAAWGADLVVSGNSHVYERLTVSGLNYVVAGIGGATLRDFGAAITGSQVRYNTKHGAVFITANCSELVLTAESVDGDIIDTLTLNT